jgi:hypothetical protein
VHQRKMRGTDADDREAGEIRSPERHPQCGDDADADGELKRVGEQQSEDHRARDTFMTTVASLLESAGTAGRNQKTAYAR